jgi:DNA mismatch repair protein MutL
MATAQWSSLQILGQARLTYIISQSSESLFLIDQHAAHERILFETLMNSWNTGRKEVQNFLLPLSLGIEADHLEAIMSRASDLEKLGIGVEQSGPESLAVNSCPVILKEAAVEKALRWLGEDLVSKGGSFAFEKVVGDFFATMACHSAIRAGQVLSIDEMKNLLERMDEFSFSSFCPHGRPVFVDYPFRKIEKEFGRLG